MGRMGDKHRGKISQFENGWESLVSIITERSMANRYYVEANLRRKTDNFLATRGPCNKFVTIAALTFISGIDRAPLLTNEGINTLFTSEGTKAAGKE